MIKSLEELIFIESLRFYFSVTFIQPKFDTPNVNFYLPTKKHFLQKLTPSNKRQIKLVNFEKRFAQFYKKIFKSQCFSCYVDMIMM